MSTAYIALGSNLSNPESQLKRAVESIATLPTSTVGAISSVYSSAAVGPGEQPSYLNAVLSLSTRLQPLELLGALNRIEDEQGRIRNEHWGARTLDLDILLYDQQAIDHERLQIPHPRMFQRNFVLYPLAEIATKQLQLPNGHDLATLLDQCPKGELSRTQISLAHDLVSS